jgi:hypothetical protein
VPAPTAHHTLAAAGGSLWVGGAGIRGRFPATRRTRLRIVLIAATPSPEPRPARGTGRSPGTTKRCAGRAHRRSRTRTRSPRAPGPRGSASRSRRSDPSTARRMYSGRLLRPVVRFTHNLGADDGLTPLAIIAGPFHPSASPRPPPLIKNRPNSAGVPHARLLRPNGRCAATVGLSRSGQATIPPRTPAG